MTLLFEVLVVASVPVQARNPICLCRPLRPMAG
jgi:hypothetical protein